MPTVDNETFARLFAAHHRRLFGYIRAMVPNRADAEEVFQETCVVLWKEFERYDASRPFAPWALATALNQIRTFRHHKRRQRLVFSDALLDQLSSDEALLSDTLAQRSEALEYCLKTLKDSERESLQQFYVTGTTASLMAELSQQKVNTIYKVLRRLRLRLLECVERRMAAENR